MSYNLAIWKRSDRTKTAMLFECYDAIIEDNSHTAMEFFNENEFLNGFEEEFGKRQKGYFGKEIDDCPFLFSTGTGEFGNWVLMHLNSSSQQITTNKIIAVALKHGLMVYDPQRKAVWGNKRPVKKIS